MRTAAALLATLALAACTTTQPLCQRAEVLQELGRVLRTRNVTSTVDEFSVAEAPADRANAALCTAAVSTIGYQPTATGWRPQLLTTPQRYDVAVANSRFVVRVAP